jgi:hypothetical protein
MMLLKETQRAPGPLCGVLVSRWAAYTLVVVS